jgi:hypothetical protein
MNAISFFALVLAVWRVTHLIVVEDGPWNVLRRMRGIAEPIGLQRLINCFLCCSVWVAVPFALFLGRDWRMLVIAIPALSGGAILLERATRRRDDAAAWIETREE